MTDSVPDLSQIRDRIETIDQAILEKLAERMAVVEDVAQSKIRRAVPFRDPLREEKVLIRVRQIATNFGIDPHSIEALYRQIMDMSIARQQEYLNNLSVAPLRVAYQGVEGAYTHLAAQRRYRDRPGGVLLNGFETFHQAADAVLEGAADIALLPIENTTAGSINETYDILADGGLVINAEVISRIQHCLLVKPGVPLEDVREIHSHPQALGQCATFIRSLPVRAISEFDTAGAARKVKESDRSDLAAIASESAASRFGLSIIARDIQNEAGNYTRFVEVAREATACPADSSCKTSLMIRLTDQPGALGKVLTEFSQHAINLTKLESRPEPATPFQYRFYLDIDGHRDSQPVADALNAIQAHLSDLRVLGTYPQAT